MAEVVITRQDAYWQSEANMAEGSPVLALERRREGSDTAGGLVPGPRRT